MFACRQAEGKHSSCGALHNDNNVACEIDVDGTKVEISWTPEAKV